MKPVIRKLLIFILTFLISTLAQSSVQRRSHAHSTSRTYRNAGYHISSPRHSSPGTSHSSTRVSTGSHQGRTHSSVHISGGSHRTFHSSVRSTGSQHRSTYDSGATRDSHGRIKRSGKARYEFMKQTGYPHGRKGYVIDHIIPLKKGGCDCPSNMQWQTIEAAKAKDKWEAP